MQPQVEYQAATEKNTRGALDPNITQHVLEIFNEVFYDYDEDDGEITMDRYKQVMRFVKAKESIPTFPNPKDDPFSEANLEEAYHREDRIKYNDKDKIDGKISHRSVLYICHDILADLIKKAKSSAPVVKATKKAPKKNEEMARIEARLNEINAKMDELDRPTVDL